MGRGRAMARGLGREAKSVGVERDSAGCWVDLVGAVERERAV